MKIKQHILGFANFINNLIIREIAEAILYPGIFRRLFFGATSPLDHNCSDCKNFEKCEQ